MTHGKAGAEVLSSILGRIFSRAVKEIYGRGGMIAQFEGDAVLAVFPPDRPQDALDAAQSLDLYFKKNLHRRTRFGDWEVSARLALAAGPIEWGIVGKKKLIHYVKGDPITRAFSLISEASPVSLQFDESFQVIQEGPIEAAITGSEGTCSGIYDNTSRIRKTVAKRFVPDLILSCSLTGEFREITTVFVALRRSSLKKTHSSIQSILEKAAYYGGYVSGLYFTSSKPLITILFGAPVSWENNESRSCRFACDLKESIGEGMRCGIVSGTVYAGMTGNSRRCTYTVFGDTINTSARLVFKAGWGDVLVSEETSARTEKDFAWGGRTSCSLRGKREDTMILHLLNCQDSSIRRIYQGEMLGRSSELRSIRRRLYTLKHGAFAGVTTVYGEAGIGKSRLIHEAALEHDGLSQTFVLRCDDVLKTSLNPFEYFFRDYFRQSSSKSAQENRRAFEEGMEFLAVRLESCAAENAPSLAENLRMYQSMVGSVLGHFRKGSVFEQLDPGKRFENIAVATGILIGALATIRPFILIVEDLQWMDDDSKRLLGFISGELTKYPVALLISSRYTDDGSKPETGIEHRVDYASIDLEPVDAETSRSIVSAHFSQDPGDDLTAFIHERTMGNPFYIDQFCVYLKNSGFVERRKKGWRLVSRNKEVPSGILSILVARMDRLHSRLKKLVQTASVLGQEFDLNVLSEISEEKNTDYLLWQGVSEQLWTRTKETTYAFNHALYRDTAYSMLLERELKKLHMKAADVILSRNKNDPDKVAGKIAFHMENSGKQSEASEWGWKALLQADKNSRLHECLRWTEKLQSMLLKNSTDGSRPKLLCNVLFRRNGVLSQLGRHVEQGKNLELLVKLCECESWEDRTTDLLNIRAHYCNSIGRVDEAFSLYEKGLEVAELEKNLESQAMILGNIGILHRGAEHIDKARDCYERALGTYRKLGDRKGEGNILGNLALLLRHQGCTADAEKHYMQALRIHREVGNRRAEGYILNGLGNLSEDKDAALEWFRMSLTINREVGDRKAVGIALGNIGQIESEWGHFEIAAQNLYRALDIFRDIDNLPLQAGTLHIIGEMDISRGDLDAAYSNIQESIDISRRSKRRRTEVFATILLGRIGVLKGDTESALELYTRSYDQIIKYGFSFEIDEKFTQLRKLLIENGTDPSVLPWPSGWDQTDRNTTPLQLPVG
ncbi:MAG: tetratricopeptide repeat protein [Candidatus Aegiribacteria sp.]|nr:tetratricopeptide repeat protein [Candidatus Aegiribacteria sp.]